MPARESAVDACPGALRLHAAADGPLARVRLPGGLLTGAQLTTLATLAAQFGDGRLELTSRANLQLRALTDADPTVLAAALTAAGLLPSETHETVRNIVAPPLAGATLRALVAELDRALCADPALAALPGRFLFALGAVPLSADLAAVPVDETFAILFAGHDPGLRVPATDVVRTLLTAANAFLTERAETTAWRLHELPDGPSRIATRTAAALGLPTLPPSTAVPLSADATLLGIVPQGDGLVAVGALVPLGRLGGEALRLLGTARRLVVTPWRGVLVPDLTVEAARRWARALAEAGLPVEPATRWAGVTACAGRPGCAKSLADVRADADRSSVYSDGLPVHWIGCARGCGSPAGAHVRVEATPDGYAVTRQPDGETFTGDTAHAVAAARRN
ncbi:precorrin-3B synthase [Paractinoplanes abujensis]|uniref:Precorrin-3B synthase n=1 Tax=Paractinoplanes abujensis TaxID=882441 RepID=A0A7W7CZW4_9ACTN|nr:precorrin-3B synthase [Actinoplanes abujensis]MBB4697692.1 precorrin-3B synthase [Actinoplanes abujensis]GID19820.1 precorrin-3B synthase [Actinoplanes abujensis]